LDRRGRRVRITELDARRRRERAPFRCLGCGEPLVARLGRQRAHHFAHPPGSRCPLTAPETALHLDAKERLLRLCAEAFSSRRRVILEARCPGCRRRTSLDLSTLGDGAVAEGSVGPLRADVLVTLRGAPAAALEVRVAHALTAEKEEVLTRLSVPVLEIDAREEWESQDEGEVRVACVRSLGIPLCGGCQATARADADRSAGGEAAAVAELETYRVRRLLGPPPGPAAVAAPELSATERRKLTRSFRCAHCGGSELQVGARLVRHACPGREPRAVAWRGYDGTLVTLDWWRRG
jgi:hypothetical protein